MEVPQTDVISAPSHQRENDSYDGHQTEVPTKIRNSRVNSVDSTPSWEIVSKQLTKQRCFDFRVHFPDNDNDDQLISPVNENRPIRNTFLRPLAIESASSSSATTYNFFNCLFK